MKVQKAELAQKIAKIKSVVPKKASMPVLQGILVKDGYLIANNTEMTVKAKLEGIKGESFIIPAKAFDLIANLPEGELEILLEENNVITIKADKIKNTYVMTDMNMSITG
jgi:DNA polymerase sliding clamp subunit (PCNA homolog)